MKVTGRGRLTVLFFVAIFLTCVSIGAVSLAQGREGFVREGESLDGIMIGTSTESEVIGIYGNDYKLVDHNRYSYEMIYKKLGLSFYYCQADPNKEIFVVEMQSPAKITTGKGIKLGESTFADVFRLYGKGDDTYSDADYDGIHFYYGEDTGNEDSEDARNPAQPAANEKSPAIVSPAVTDTNLTDMSNVVLDGTDVSDTSADDDDEAADDNEDASESRSARSEQNQADDRNPIKNKIVKRIELVEKSDLRQCTSKFPKK